MIRLYCPELNVFIDPTDRNILVWFQQHRVDHTIGVLQTFLLYEGTRTVPGVKYWDKETRTIRYGKKRKTKVSGRYQLYSVPWSGLYDCHNRPIFHGDLLKSEDAKPLVCDVGVGSIRLLRHNTGLSWSEPDVQVIGLQRIGSALLDPQLVCETMRPLFVYPKSEES